MDKILISGTGLIASHLAPALKSRGMECVFLSTSKSSFCDCPCYYWDPIKYEMDERALDGVTHIIHLAGAAIADVRWTKKRKKELVDSRVQSAQLLYNLVDAKKTPLRAFISASGVGYYGAVNSEKYFTEDNEPGEDFLAEICIQWENAAKKFESLEIRTVILRSGIVLAKDHSALQKLAKPIKMGFGAAIGNGKQYFPWIHIADITNIYLEAVLNDKMSGIYNASGPNSTTNLEITKEIAKVLNKKLYLPNIPVFVMKLLFGELSIALTKGSRVSVSKLQALDFQFNYVKLNESLRDLLK